MPTPLADKSIVQVTWWQKYQNQRLLNVQLYEANLGTPVPDYRVELAALLANFTGAGQVNARMAACCSTSWTLEYVGAQPIRDTRLKTVFISPNIAGLKGGTTTPSNVAATIVKESDSAERWGVGVWHQGGLIATDTAGGDISPALQTNLFDLATQLIVQQNGTVGNLFVPVLWNKLVPLRRTPIVDFNINGDSRIMRRRSHFLGI